MVARVHKERALILLHPVAEQHRLPCLAAEEQDAQGRLKPRARLQQQALCVFRKASSRQQHAEQKHADWHGARLCSWQQRICGGQGCHEVRVPPWKLACAVVLHGLIGGAQAGVTDL